MSKEEGAKFNLCPKRTLSPSFQGEKAHKPLKINTFEPQLDETTSSCEQSSIESESGHVKNSSKSSLSPRKRSKFRDIYKIIITTFIMLLASNLLTTPCSEHSSITSNSPIRFNDGVETHFINGICPSFQGRIQHFDNATPPKPPDIPSTRKISTASVHQFIKPPSSNIALDDSPQYSPITIFAHIATNLHLITWIHDPSFQGSVNFIFITYLLHHLITSSNDDINNHLPPHHLNTSPWITYITTSMNINDDELALKNQAWSRSIRQLTPHSIIIVINIYHLWHLFISS